MAKPIINAELVRSVLRRVDAVLSQPHVPKGWSKMIAGEFGLNRQQVQGLKKRFGSADRVPNDLGGTGSALRASPVAHPEASKVQRREDVLLKRPTNIAPLRRKLLALIKPEPAPEALPNPIPEETPREVLGLKAQIRDLKIIIADQAIELHRVRQDLA